MGSSPAEAGESRPEDSGGRPGRRTAGALRTVSSGGRRADRSRTGGPAGQELTGQESAGS